MLRVVGSVKGATTDEPIVAVTFDDGPDPFYTSRLLDLLRRQGVKATFFVLADRVEEYPELALRICEEGHEVALHGGDHSRLTECSVSQVVACIRDGRRRVEAITGRRIRLFRPPYGAQSAVSYAVARLCGMQVVGWTMDPKDWCDDHGGDDPSISTSWMTDDVGPGGVVLLHDGRDVIAERLLKELDVRDMQVVTVSELLARGRPVRYCWFNQ